MIRTALLCVPQLDEDALDAVRAVLRRVPGLVVVEARAVASQRTWLAEVLRAWCDEEEMDLVLTIGGSLPAPGPAPREIVPEATHDVIERHTPALSEAMRAAAPLEEPLTLLDRGVAGIRSRTLIVNLPAGAAAAQWLEAIVDILPAYSAHLQQEPPAPPEPPARMGLNADDFTAYLKRNRKP